MVPVIIGISGGTGVGKTTIAGKIIADFNCVDVVLIHQDSYYKDLSHLPESERNKINFDHPNALNNELLIKHLEELKEGNSIELPQYDFNTHTRRKETITINAPKVIILEGILIFFDIKIREFLDIKIYVDADADTRMLRRIQRDMVERNRTFESIKDQYLNTVKPMYLEFVQPGKRWADIIIQTENHENDAGIDLIIQKVRSLVSKC